MTAPTAGSDGTLSPRALNRATLARQHLLARERVGALDAIEGVAGLQAQAPHGPYVSLWSRLEGFDPAELSALLVERQAVRVVLMRGTIHLVSDRDCLEWWPLTEPVLARAFRGSAFSKELGGAKLSEVLAAGRELLAAEPLMRSEAGRRLHERWPQAAPASLGHALGYGLPLVQVPPRGLWGKGGRALLTPVEGWLGRELSGEPSIDRLFLRYLAALGPASVKDFQNWSGLTRIAAVAERLRPQLRSFRSEDGAELFDLPDAPRPGAEPEVPPRFLPEFDNVLLGHADRSRFIDGDAEGYRYMRGNGADNGNLLVGGLLKATWKLHQEDGAATLRVLHFKPLTTAEATAVEAEGAALLDLLAPDATGRSVELETV